MVGWILVPGEVNNKWSLFCPMEKYVYGVRITTYACFVTVVDSAVGYHKNFQASFCSAME